MESSTPPVDVPRTRWAPVAALGLAMLVVTAEMTVTAVTLPGLGAELGVPAAATAWVLLGYALPMAAVAIPAGRWADRADPRAALVLAMVGVGVASVLTALAPTFWLLVVGRVLQGLAASLVVAAYMPIVMVSVVPAQRGRAIGYIITIMTVGGMAGAPLGGLIAGSVGWRGVFLMKLPLLVAVVVAALRGLSRDDRGLPRPGVALLREALLLGAAVGALLLVVEFADEAPVLAAGLAVLAVVAGLGWARLPGAGPVVALIRGREFGAVLVALLAASFVVGLIAFLLPFFVAEVLHGTPELTGLALLFFVGAVAPVSVLAGWLADRFGTRPIAIAGSALSIAGLGAVLTLDAGAGLGDLAWRLALLGIGGGLFNPAINAATLAAAPSGMEGTAGGVAMTARTVALTVAPGLAALCWTLAGGGVPGFRTGVAVLAAISALGLLALLVPARRRDGAPARATVHRP